MSFIAVLLGFSLITLYDGAVINPRVPYNFHELPTNETLDRNHQYDSNYFPQPNMHKERGQTPFMTEQGKRIPNMFEPNFHPFNEKHWQNDRAHDIRRQMKQMHRPPVSDWNLNHHQSEPNAERHMTPPRNHPHFAQHEFAGRFDQHHRDKVQHDLQQRSKVLPKLESEELRDFEFNDQAKLNHNDDVLVHSKIDNDKLNFRINKLMDTITNNNVKQKVEEDIGPKHSSEGESGVRTLANKRASSEGNKAMIVNERSAPSKWDDQPGTNIKRKSFKTPNWNANDLSHTEQKPLVKLINRDSPENVGKRFMNEHLPNLPNAAHEQLKGNLATNEQSTPIQFIDSIDSKGFMQKNINDGKAKHWMNLRLLTDDDGKLKLEVIPSANKFGETSWSGSGISSTLMKNQNNFELLSSKEEEKHDDHIEFVAPDLQTSDFHHKFERPPLPNGPNGHRNFDFRNGHNRALHGDESSKRFSTSNHPNRAFSSDRTPHEPFARNNFENFRRIQDKPYSMFEQAGLNPFMGICPEVKCNNMCAGGLNKLSPQTGCPLCECCSVVPCNVKCAFGYEADDNGCPLCKCSAN